MPIASTSPLTAPGPANQLAVALHVSPVYTATGVTASVTISAQRYAAGTGGQPVKVGDPVAKSWPDVFAAAATDANVATALTAIEAAVAAYVAATSMA